VLAPAEPATRRGWHLAQQASIITNQFFNGVLRQRWYQKVLKKCQFLLIFAKNQSLLLTFGEFSVLFGTFLPSFLAQKCNSPIISLLSVAPTTPIPKFSFKNRLFWLFPDFFTLLFYTYTVAQRPCNFDFCPLIFDILFLSPTPYPLFSVPSQ
jgi:hypothetical protein